jgi:hypothetical protein
MKSYSELEVVIQQDASHQYQVNARRRLEEGDSITPFVPLELTLDDPSLFSGDPLLAGRVLSNALFSNSVVRDTFMAAQEYASQVGMPLRIRLRVDPSTSALHGLPWETLVHPAAPDTPLLRNGHCVFSRYLFTREFRLPMLRAKQDIKALLVIANPDDLSQSFSPIDVTHELDIAQRALYPVRATTLAERGSATLQALMEGLQDGADVLYLMCHGMIGPKGPALWLEDAGGSADLVTGDEFAARIAALKRPPSLIVLCSCQSAGAGTPARDALTAIGPMLAKEGVPAVLAMQGKFSIETAGVFMPTFFKELADHGEVDRAAANARALVMHSPDWWMPVVFTRLDSARIWYPPGFGACDDGLDPWDSIVDNLNEGDCTPILGPTMNETLFGSRRDLAALWGEMYRYPMSGRDIEDLPQVAQYLAVTRQGAFPRRELCKSVYRRIIERFPNDVPSELRGLDSRAVKNLNKLISSVGRNIRARDPNDPHTVLANYRLPLYVTTDPSDLLIDALKETGAIPRVRLLRWNESAERCDEQNVLESEVAANLKPSAEYPIVVKLFGDLSEQGSLVLTEDQFFDYLAKATSMKDAVPPVVRSRLSDSALMFVGFQADSWEFRVLFRSLLQQIEGRDLLKDYEHLSVQIDPNSILDPGSARRYIEKYLQTKAKRLRLYWGDVPTFICELKSRTQRRS